MTAENPTIPPALRHSPALIRRHLRQLAQDARAQESPHGPHRGSAYELLLIQLAQHRARLKMIQSTERKIEAKKGFLPLYDDWIDATLSARPGAKDEVFSTLLIWHIDCERYRRALDMAEYAISANLDTPDSFERSLPVAVAEEFATGYLVGKFKPEDHAVETLLAVHQLTEPFDAHDQVRSKLHKAIGLAIVGKVPPADIDLTAVTAQTASNALHHLQRALDLYESAGVKKDIERLLRHIKNLGGSPETPGEQAPEPPAA